MWVWRPRGVAFWSGVMLWLARKLPLRLSVFARTE